MLLEANADINAMDKNKTTPLHLAARYGHEKVAKLLIERGASVTQINSNGHNPLITAILHGKRFVVIGTVIGITKPPRREGAQSALLHTMQPY